MHNKQYLDNPRTIPHYASSLVREGRNCLQSGPWCKVWDCCLEGHWGCVTSTGMQFLCPGVSSPPHCPATIVQVIQTKLSIFLRFRNLSPKHLFLFLNIKLKVNFPLILMILAFIQSRKQEIKKNQKNLAVLVCVPQVEQSHLLRDTCLREATIPTNIRTRTHFIYLLLFFPGPSGKLILTQSHTYMMGKLWLVGQMWPNTAT